MSFILREHRCSQCKKLLFRGLLLSGILEIKCSRCKTENTIHGISGLSKKEGHYFIVFDYEGKIVDASSSTNRILGYSKKELLGMRRRDLNSDINEADYEMLRAIIMSGVGAPAFDTVHQRKDGMMIPVKLRVKVLTAEGSRYALVVGKVLGSSTSAAMDSEARYEFSVNAKGQFLYISNPLASRLGYQWLSLIGKPLSDVLKPAGAKKGQAGFMRMFSTELFFALKGAKMVCHDKSSIVFDFSFHPHEDDYEGFEGYDVAGSIIDLS